MSTEQTAASRPVEGIVMRLRKWRVSRVNGLSIGDVRYLKASPFIVGQMCHFLPSECWSNEERNALRYCANKQRWNGLRWEFVERLELTQQEWREILSHNATNHAVAGRDSAT